MQSLQVGLRSARLLSAACRSETLHDALSVAQRTMTMPCQSIAMTVSSVRYPALRNGWLPRLWSGTSNACLRQCLFEESVDVPVQSRVTAVLHTPTDVSVTNGSMLRLQVQVDWLSYLARSFSTSHLPSFSATQYLVYRCCRLQITCEDSPGASSDSFVLHRAADSAVGQYQTPLTLRSITCSVVQGQGISR